jgi:hypothetical protein
MTRERWRLWLLAAAAFVVLAGLGLVLLALFGSMRWLMEVLYLPGEPDVAAARTLSFAIGVSGAVMIGWGVSMLLVFAAASSAEQPRIARAFLAGVIVWFVLDCTVSLALGAVLNAAANVIFLATLLPPLAALGRRPDA